MLMSRKPYLINLREYLAECDVNYLRLSKLARNTEQNDSWEYGVSLTKNSTGSLQIRVTERCRFTTMLELNFSSGMQHSETNRMSVRMYHDIRAVEVIACNNARGIAPHYNYPNRAMHHPDEKEQLNRLLGEWLTLCLKYGHVKEEFILANQTANQVAN